jgi:pimeloyl-ACP methyl ester carboxylesterase
VQVFLDDVDFDGQLQRSIGKADSGMANAGECLAIAQRITPGDRDSWYEAWSTFADQLVKQGRKASAAGHKVSARHAFLRATEYFRQAFFFHRDRLDGKELTSAYGASVQAFQSALPLLDYKVERIRGDQFSGYLFALQDVPRPTLLHFGGYDSTAEELYASVFEALSRGYAFAAIDGPGQGATLYDKHIPMRPDWENVVPGMVDQLIKHSSVDPHKIVLVGRSFGGLIGPRGASGERRLAAMIVDPGQTEMASSVMNRLGALGRQLDDPAADAQFEALLSNPRFRALLAPRMTTHGITSVRGYCKDLLRYTNEKTAAQIGCPSFVTDNEVDGVSLGQGKLLFDRLTCPKTFRLFTKAEGAAGHCEGMAPTLFWAAALDWLDDTLPNARR